MMKIRKKPVFGIMLLLMLGVSPISVTYSFADTSKTDQDETHEKQLRIEKNTQNEKIKGILTEKIVNGNKEESKFWTIVSNNPAKFQENPSISELKSNSSEMAELSDKTISEENFSYKVIFSGNNANMIEENEYVISLMKLGVDSHYEENEILQSTDKNKSYPILIEPTNFNQKLCRYDSRIT